MLSKILRIAIPLIVVVVLGFIILRAIQRQIFDKRLAAAEEALKARRYADATKIYEELLKAKPNEPGQFWEASGRSSLRAKPPGIYPLMRALPKSSKSIASKGISSGRIALNS